MAYSNFSGGTRYMPDHDGSSSLALVRGPPIVCRSLPVSSPQIFGHQSAGYVPNMERTAFEGKPIVKYGPAVAYLEFTKVSGRSRIICIRNSTSAGHTSQPGSLVVFQVTPRFLPDRR